MKKLLCWLMGMGLLTVSQVGADDLGKMEGISRPAAGSTPVMKHKANKIKKKSAGPKKEMAVWVCPMGDYSGPKTADGKCPKCGMELEIKK